MLHYNLLRLNGLKRHKRDASGVTRVDNAIAETGPYISYWVGIFRDGGVPVGSEGERDSGREKEGDGRKRVKERERESNMEIKCDALPHRHAMVTHQVTHTSISLG